MGLYSVVGLGKAPLGLIDPISGKDVVGKNLYDIQPDQRLAHYAGCLTVDWGRGALAWVQRADRHDKPVLEIRRGTVEEEPFPGFTQFCCDVEQIEKIPPSWQEVLKSVKGVYALICKETGKIYVGSAKGEDSLWGRFSDYARTGHGGNVELRRRETNSYQVTVLEVVSSDLWIERVETAWKKKLMTREFGLNKN